MQQQNHPMLHSITDCLTITLAAAFLTRTLVFLVALGAFVVNEVIF